MKNTSSFQTILLFIFGIGAVIGVIFFAVYRATSGGANLPELEMWGTLPAEYFSYVGGDETGDAHLKKVKYREIRAEEFDQTLIEALADGVGPDIVVIGHDSLYKHRHRLYELPFESYSASDYNASYIQAGQVFRGEAGFYAFPAVVDPLVMYWNRSILASNGMAGPPDTWDAMRDFSQQVSKTDGFLNVIQSAVSLGTYSNINHAKDLISLLLLQSGTRIALKGTNGYVADFTQQSSDISLPPSEAINFYTEFADPSKLAYSWNTSLPSSRAAFLSEDLALYFGLASEESELISANPNLSFGVAMMPQVASSSVKMTTGNVYGFAVMKSSPYVESAFQSVYRLASPEMLAELDSRTELPSVHTALLKVDPARASSATLVNSALIVNTWLDPDTGETDRFFGDMIEAVRSNSLDAKDALTRLASQINQLFRN